MHTSNWVAGIEFCVSNVLAQSSCSVLHLFVCISRFTQLGTRMQRWNVKHVQDFPSAMTNRHCVIVNGQFLDCVSYSVRRPRGGLFFLVSPLEGREVICENMYVIRTLTNEYMHIFTDDFLQRSMPKKKRGSRALSVNAMRVCV
jgi:hypothetical protein